MSAPFNVAWPNLHIDDAYSKYVVLTQINENLGQGGRCVSTNSLSYHRLTYAVCRADLVCHWEDSDIVAQEVFTNVRTRQNLDRFSTHLLCSIR